MGSSLGRAISDFGSAASDQEKIGAAESKARPCPAHCTPWSNLLFGFGIPQLSVIASLVILLFGVYRLPSLSYFKKSAGDRDCIETKASEDL
ncbi:hypothetical protein RW64_11895 [Geobacter sulfurreducens]|nr:hypothetical protein RW64_11895 [Geobacter sulfurreducens]